MLEEVRSEWWSVCQKVREWGALKKWKDIRATTYILRIALGETFLKQEKGQFDTSLLSESPTHTNHNWSRTQGHPKNVAMDIQLVLNNHKTQEMVYKFYNFK